MHVRIFNPTIVAHAANLAKLHELSCGPNTRPFTKYPAWSSKPSSPNTNPANKHVFNHTSKTFSADDMADRRAKGLCMFCDEPFTPGHHLKHRKYQFTMLEMEYEPTTET